MNDDETESINGAVNCEGCDHAINEMSFACLFCGRKTLDYVFACQTFSGYFLLLLALVQISKIVGARGIGGDGFLRRFLLQWFLLRF